MQREERGRDISTYQCSNKITTKKLSTHTQKRVPLPLAVLFFVSCVHPCLPPSQQFYFSEPSVPRCVSGPSSPDPKKASQDAETSYAEPFFFFLHRILFMLPEKDSCVFMQKQSSKKDPSCQGRRSKALFTDCYSSRKTHEQRH